MPLPELWTVILYDLNIKYQGIKYEECLNDTDFISRYIEYTDIHHMFSYTEFIRTRSRLAKDYFDQYVGTSGISQHRLVGLDCEMIETDRGQELGRVTIVGQDGRVVYDQFVIPNGNVVDYRTKWSGITETDLKDGIGFKLAQSKVLQIVGSNTILVGHSLEHDLKVLCIKHGRIIDTAYQFLSTDGFKVALKTLVQKHLGSRIQQGSHDSAEDALSSLRLLGLRVWQLQNMISKKKQIVLDGTVRMIKVGNRREIKGIEGYKVVLVEKNGMKYVAYE
ncbi:REXO1 [Enterospora canceri]|uniref:REXO1 n=1 Tax=Enterospora canceri TaxID=1081671 RepID=A0A1Y1S8D7_9MICR|nr:REXO1 [Enterospora canceri]